MDANQNFTYPVRLRLSREELDALASMAHDELRDLENQAYYSLRCVMIKRGYLPNGPQGIQP